MLPELRRPNISGLRETLDLLGFAMTCFRQTLKGASDPLHYAAYFSDRIGVQASTILYLATEGTPVPLPTRPDNRFTDVWSIVTLTRSALESYLLFFHIFVDSQPPSDTFTFRYGMWHLDSLLARQGPTMLGKDGIRDVEIIRALLVDEPAKIAELREEISQTADFKALKKKLQEKILTGDKIDKNWWRPGWIKLAEQVGFGDKAAKQIYAYYSMYAHSSSISGWQVDQMTTEERREMAEGRLPILEILASKMIIDFIELAPEIEPLIENENPEGLRRANLLSLVPGELP